MSQKLPFIVIESSISDTTYGDKSLLPQSRNWSTRCSIQLRRCAPFTNETKSRMKRCWFCRMRRENLWATRLWDSCRRSRVWDVSPISDDEHINWLEPSRQNWENRNRILLEDRDNKSFLVRASILSCNLSSAFSILKRYPLQESKSDCRLVIRHALETHYSVLRTCTQN